MASQSSLYVFTAFLAAIIGSSTAHQFVVGGKSGWIINPSENYNHWAERTRFHVNDTLVFKYKNREDNVLIVNRRDYDSCNINNPIEKFDGGHSVFKFYRSGPFYFISGHNDNCQKGQKLIIVVMAVRTKYPPPPPPSFPHHAPAPSGGETTTPAPAPADEGGDQTSSPAPATRGGDDSRSVPATISVPPAHKSAASGVSGRQWVAVIWMIILIINV
ncbi:early nodulin-like protein 1 [Impatiens glandulifera]|uniref:early nodulin-like protein 1 n=1 Tax=Impatiens glandulifera TaxID=253017 RepID=UPI001FB1646D|nr:early nodulin-like protein 1 [Impatiens glandulifera]